MIEATIMIDVLAHPSELMQFVKHLEKNFPDVDYKKQDGIILVKSKKDMSKDVFVQHCSGYERYIDALSIHRVETEKDEYWDELGQELGFTTADKYVHEM